MIETRIAQPGDTALEEATSLLRDGQTVAFPTETVYGLGANACDDEACKRIYQAKGRPGFNPLIVHFASAEQAEKEVVFSSPARKLARAFWPGPMTLVLQKRQDCRLSDICSPGLETQAVRVPAHPLAQRLLKSCALPLAAPSANASGKISPTKAEHVFASLNGRIPLILDGGACQDGLESTVIDLSDETTPVILRPGTLPAEEIEAVLGMPVGKSASLMEQKAEQDATGMASPGLLKSHYAPEKPLRLDAGEVESYEALLAFGPAPLSGAAATINLSSSGNLEEAASALFNALHELDQVRGILGIAAMPIPKEGIGLAINDRLKRAAAPKS
ncbi:L-threonylcarbamoyladenylate synthase [Kiloniella sp. b19]|uniref:L-threonylcarbamoyladenylate synthase n=1 Tax=Kiloniella sp. GXU_MW_B19 TaxID=3141326 RepID=UPI0031DA2F8B